MCINTLHKGDSNNNNNNNNNNKKHKLITLDEKLTPSAVTNLIHHCDIWVNKNKNK
jgi:hypothetical protein